MVFGYLYLILGLVVIVAGEDVVINEYTCDKVIDLEDTKSVDIKYNGESTDTKKCTIEFHLDDTSDYEICVKPVEVELDCATKIEYHRYFVSIYSNDGEITCHSTNLTELCEEYVDKYFVSMVKETPYVDSSESFHIRVYAKEREGSSSSNGIGKIRWTTWLRYVGIAIGVVIAAILIGWKVKKCRQQRREKKDRARYNAAIDAATVQTAPPEESKQ